MIKRILSVALIALTSACTTVSTPLIVNSLPVPVIIYHRITSDLAPSDTVISPARFKEHASAIRQAGYSAITVSQLTNSMLGRIKLPPKPVAITFDDGWKEQLWAAKLLASKGMAATFFVMSGTLQDKNYFSREDILAVASNPRFEIGSHTHTHFNNWADNLSSLETHIMLAEASLSKRILEEIVGKPVGAIAWPFGYTTLATIQGAMRLGYTSTSIVSDGSSKNTSADSVEEIHRLNINGHCTADHVLKMLTTAELVDCKK